MLELSGVFMLATFIIFSLYGLFAAAMRDKVVGSPRVMAWMRRTFSAAFVALGARLALQQQ
jgi:threonine/homoserine/homoserine lactone efflux protein